MILILSTDSDIVSNEVTGWLSHYNKSYYRLNDNDVLKADLDFQMTKEGDPYFSISSSKGILNSKDVSVVWLRKFGYYNCLPGFQALETEFGSNFLQQWRHEYFSSLGIIFQCLENKKWLIRPGVSAPFKMDVLSKAIKAGLKIPYTRVTNNKEVLDQSLMSRKLITKSLKDCHSFSTKGHFVTLFTTLLDNKFGKKIPRKYMPSLIQEYQEKEFELRIFYLYGEISSMAIFSQTDDQTKIDFRKYNYKKPNRYIPFTLPCEIKEKITVMMQSLEMDTGSIDMIYTKEKEYVFLEVNPCGQFGMVSKPCNFPLEKQIANALINIYDEKVHNPY